MLGVSRGSSEESRSALQAALDSGTDRGVLADELFAVVGVLDDNSALRRALGDPSQEGARKRELAKQLFGDRLQPASLEVLEVAVAQRWARERDLADALENAAIETQIAMADDAGRADDVEEQLFRFERTVAASPELRDALIDPQLPTERKTQLVDRLLEGKVHPETARLAHQGVAAPRGRRFDATIENVLEVAATRRSRLTAIVTVAQVLTQEQHDRLAAALAGQYGRPVIVQVVLDEHVLGGIRVEVGDEVVDGTISRRLDEARRRMGE